MRVHVFVLLLLSLGASFSIECDIAARLHKNFSMFAKVFFYLFLFFIHPLKKSISQYNEVKPQFYFFLTTFTCGSFALLLYSSLLIFLRSNSASFFILFSLPATTLILLTFLVSCSFFFINVVIIYFHPFCLFN